MTLTENCKIVQALAPKTTNGAKVGAYVSLKNANMAHIVMSFTQAVAQATVITIEQATAVAGTDSKVIANVVPIWANEDTAATDTLVRQAAAVGYTLAADVKNKQVIFQIDPALLDIANDFDCIVVKVATSGQATNFVSANYMLDMRYKQATPPSAILD